MMWHLDNTCGIFTTVAFRQHLWYFYNCGI